jgi:hypothetical protein
MRVIAIAYGYVPLDRVATGETADLIYVAAPSALNAEGGNGFVGVGFPRESVYCFELGLFESLSSAKGDERAIRALLRRAARPAVGCLARDPLLKEAA